MSMASSVQPAGQDSAFFDFMAQTVVSRRSFLAEHPSLEELALAKMMPGRLWPRLAGDLPHDALPNLRHLQCAPHQAAALLQNPRPCLKTLLGINLHTEFRECEYFSLLDEISSNQSKARKNFVRALVICEFRRGGTCFYVVLRATGQSRGWKSLVSAQFRRRQSSPLLRRKPVKSVSTSTCTDSEKIV